MDLARCCGWWWPFGGACITTPPPSALYRDDRGRLHNPAGPAIAWGDAWAIWAWHGTRVPQAVIEHSESLTAQQVLTESNAEIARAMYEIIGAERFMGSAAPAVLDTDVDGRGMARRLLRVQAGWADEPLVAVEVTCPSTGHVYHLTVPPGTRSCQEGVAWAAGMTVREYAPAIEA